MTRKIVVLCVAFVLTTGFVTSAQLQGSTAPRSFSLAWLLAPTAGCGSCAGGGHVRCASCQNGWQRCILCTNGVARCLLCQNGYFLSPLTNTYSVCPFCSGRVQYVCPICSGRGVLSCFMCGGSLVRPCDCILAKLTPLLAKGEVYSDTGGDHQVKDVIDSGRYVLLEDGSLWEIEGSDTSDTGGWYAGEDIVVLDNGLRSYKLINADEGETVEAHCIAKR